MGDNLDGYFWLSELVCVN